MYIFSLINSTPINNSYSNNLNPRNKIMAPPETPGRISPIKEEQIFQDDWSDIIDSNENWIANFEWRENISSEEDEESQEENSEEIELTDGQFECIAAIGGWWIRVRNNPDDPDGMLRYVWENAENWDLPTPPQRSSPISILVSSPSDNLLRQPPEDSSKLFNDSLIPEKSASI